MRSSVRDFPRVAITLFASALATSIASAIAAATPVATNPQLPAANSQSATVSHIAAAPTPHQPPRNVIIFIADGLRHDSVNATDAPTLFALRQRGVHFSNSHSLFPTLTTPNASAIATGHYLGDTGDFSNSEYVGYPTFNHGDFGKAPGTPTPFLENDPILGDLAGHVEGGNFVNELSLLAAAREHGFNTAAIGKLGPVAIQDLTQLKPTGGHFPIPQTVILDDSTGSAVGVPVTAEIQSALTGAGLGNIPTPREQSTGSVAKPGTLAANVGQQKWFADAATKAVLPTFAHNGRPFVLLFWSRDPDGTQHNQGDSLNQLEPGINGPTSRAAIANADANLKQLLDYVAAAPKLAATTDIFVTSDHGFATISRREVDASGKASNSYSIGFPYVGADGQPEVLDKGLPPGFLAIDLAHALDLPLFDPDTQLDSGGTAHYEPVDPTKPTGAQSRQRPIAGDGLIGGTGTVQDHVDAKVIVTASGGSDLIYIADHDRALARKVVSFLMTQDYIGALFVDPAFGAIQGALPLSAIGLEGSARMPRPSIVVSFKSFQLTPGNLLSAIQVSDTPLQEGQGMHGGFGRDSTFNNMAAVGPDFKQGYDDGMPVSNADIAPTLAHILGLPLPAKGRLQGRVLAEALTGGPDFKPFNTFTLISKATPSGLATFLKCQEYDGRKYFDTAYLAPHPPRPPKGGLSPTAVTHPALVPPPK
jgi:arylsulfatase A-like enzyme